MKHIRYEARSSAPGSVMPAVSHAAKALLTENDVAELLRTSPRCLQAWRTRGGGPAFLRVGRLVRYSQDAVQEWLDGQMRRSTSEG